MAGEAVRATRTTTDPLTVASDVADWTSGASFSQSEQQTCGTRSKVTLKIAELKTLLRERMSRSRNLSGAENVKNGRLRQPCMYEYQQEQYDTISLSVSFSSKIFVPPPPPPRHFFLFRATATCATFFSSRQWRGVAKSGASVQHCTVL